MSGNSSFLEIDLSSEHRTERRPSFPPQASSASGPQLLPALRQRFCSAVSPRQVPASPSRLNNRAPHQAQNRAGSQRREQRRGTARPCRRRALRSRAGGTALTPHRAAAGPGQDDTRPSLHTPDSRSAPRSPALPRLPSCISSVRCETKIEL